MITSASLNDIVLLSEPNSAGGTNQSLGQIVGINPDGVSFQVRGVSGHASQFVTRRLGIELTATTFKYTQFGINAKAVANPAAGVV
jgi:hypothetical protein